MKLTTQLIVFLVLVTNLAFAQKSSIEVNLNVKHVLGDVETFDRKKFVTIHASLTESDWNGDNEKADLKDDFLNGYDVYLGRNTGGIMYNFNNRITEDPARPGFANPASIASVGKSTKNSYASNTKLHGYEDRNDIVICTLPKSWYPNGHATNKNWTISKVNSDTEAFGTASGEYYGNYLKEFYGTGGTTGENQPPYAEIINEPLWKLVKEGNQQPIDVFRFHKGVAKAMKKIVPNVPVGGYCAAFPNFEEQNFQRWHDRHKLFMDTAGEEMDFWTIHLYDFPSISNGKRKYRKGSNMEATMDMLEQYSFQKFGVVKPIMVSEYGAQTHDYNNKPWSPYRDYLKVKSTNAMMMQFMERANNINKAIPFIMNKAEWGYNATTGRPHLSRLMRKADEPTSYTGKWVYAETVKLYQLWSDVKGTRVESQSDNLDILTDAYVDGDKAYVIITNLEFSPVELDLKLKGTDENITNIQLKHFYLKGGKGGIPMLDDTNVTTLPNTLTIGAEGTYIIAYTYKNAPAIDESLNEKKYYADTYLKEINGAAEVFNINGVETTKYGEAMLRVGVGRNHGASLKPFITVNGTTIQIPRNYRGDVQTDRATFFGVLEIPVPYKLLKENNKVSVTFSGNGGHISTVTMQVFNFSNNLRGVDDTVTATDNLNGQKKSFTIYPNPVKDHFRVEYNGQASSFNVQVIDLKGKVLLTNTNVTSDNRINVSQLKAGIYFVKVDSKTTSDTARIVIE